mmetsp:Transcript_77267/g.129597  ORF Transcript_77267/g.129597 Transcript_77267/m.129597 type:complete len:207 (+) Transcript_77267:842-1462(+)
MMPSHCSNSAFRSIFQTITFSGEASAINGHMINSDSDAYVCKIFCKIEIIFLARSSFSVFPSLFASCTSCADLAMRAKEAFTKMSLDMALKSLRITSRSRAVFSADNGRLNVPSSSAQMPINPWIMVLCSFIFPCATPTISFILFNTASPKATILAFSTSSVAAFAICSTFWKKGALSTGIACATWTWSCLGFVSYVCLISRIMAS